MKTRQYILKLVLVAALALAILLGGFFFVSWLYRDNSSATAIAAFSDYGQDTVDIDRYSGNLFINIINTTIPAAKVGYESKYGQELPGIAASAYNSMFNGMSFNIKDPKTYFGFVFTAFSQYDEEAANTAAIQDIDSDVPKITDFDEAPEGEIYFSEMDAYRAEEAANASGQPGEDVIENNEIAQIEDPARLEIESKQPSVLIIHTHATESYMPYPDNNYHSFNDKETVIQVGGIVTDILESKYKYNVLHDVTKHDRYSYADSYINSQKTLISQLDKNKSVKVVMDIHRDAFEVKNSADAASRKAEYTATINGKKAARISLVIGPDNKNFDELQKFAVYVQKKMDKLYPGLFYKTVIKPRGKYNQFYRDHTLLVEAGCMLNTVDEAKYTAELLGNVIGEVLKDLGQ